MGWFSRKTAEPIKPFVPVWLQGEGGEAGRFPRGYQAQLNEVYRSNPVGLRAVRLVAGLIGTLPLFITKGDARAIDLVRTNCLLERAAAALLLHGNAYVRLAVDGHDRPAELHLMRPEKITIVCGPDGWPSAYLYRAGGEATRVPKEDALGRQTVAHLKALNPSDDHYDPERDYQAGQVLAGSAGGTGADRIELPAVMSASIAKQLAEACLARRWQAGDSLKLWLPPSRLELIPGDAFQIEGDARAWIVRSASIDGMVVELDAVAAPSTIQALPADPGRPVAEPDEIIGRSQLALFELPAEGGAPDEAPTSWIAATSAGKWKSIPIELSLAASPLAGMVLGRRAIIGKAETVLDARCPMIIDEASRVIVRLVNAAQILLNADQDAMMAGANLALLGDELIQFGRAEQLDPGLFRLSHLLRGRRGTEWAAAGHAVEDVFCLMNAATIRSVDLPGSSVGAELRAIAHGVGDAAPLPVATRLVSGEAMRPPSPCHLKAIRVGSNLSLSWVRRSFRGWTWSDGVGDVPDSYPEHYRVTLQGPAGQTIVDTASRSILFDPSQVPGSAGQPIDMAVATIGAAAVSHSATQTIML
ncbi:MAG: phage tail protein [Sphingomicrobium sp.]